MCLSPINVRSPSGQKLNVDCGKCYQCLNKKRNQWTFRLLEELKVSKGAIFVTLTYDEKYLPYGEDSKSIYCVDDIQKFIRKLRDDNKKYTKNQVRYFLVGERGETNQRVHYHAIIFNLNQKVVARIQEHWMLGFVKIGTATNASIHYTTKYILKNAGQSKKDTMLLCSRRPFLGHSYINKAKKQYHRSNLDITAKMDFGKSVSMPRCIKSRIFDNKTAKLANEKALRISDDDWLKHQREFEKEGKNINLLEYINHNENIKKVNQRKKCKI